MKYLLTVLLSGLLIILMYLYQSNHLKQIIKLHQEDNELLLVKKMDAEIYETLREYEIDFNGNRMSSSLNIYDFKQQLLSLKESINEDKIILYISEEQCNTCIDSLIVYLKATPLFTEKKISIWIKSLNLRYIHWFKEQHKIESELLYKTTPEIENKLLDIESPYLFILEKGTMRINSFFIPRKDKPQFTLKYLNGIKKKYFDKNEETTFY